MAGQVARDTGTAAVTHPSADRQSFAVLLVLVLGHLCIKLFWRCLNAAIPEIESPNAQDAVVFVGVILFITDALLQNAFIQDLERFTQSPPFRYLGFGIMLIAAYTIWLLPSATTMIEIFRVELGSISCLTSGVWWSCGWDYSGRAWTRLPRAAASF